MNELEKVWYHSLSGNRISFVLSDCFWEDLSLSLSCGDMGAHAGLILPALGYMVQASPFVGVDTKPYRPLTRQPSQRTEGIGFASYFSYVDSLVLMWHHENVKHHHYAAGYGVYGNSTYLEDHTGVMAFKQPPQPHFFYY